MENKKDINIELAGHKLLLEVLEKVSLKELCDYLYVNDNTIKRWKLLKKVPKYYMMDLNNIIGRGINYDDFTYIEKDQFFTPKDTSKYCLSKLKTILESHGVDIKNYSYIEPSCGDGSFFNLLPPDRKIGIDIEPRCQGVIKNNFLNWYPDENNSYITVGNPPFGLRGNLALRFINHASNFSDFVAFILPPLFDSDGKGTCKSRVKNMNLIHTEKINTDFYYPDGKSISINVVFQIWSKNIKIEEPEKIDCSEYIKIYSLSDGGTPSTTRNKKMHDKCDYYFASTSFEKEKMKYYSSFEQLPHRRGYGLVILKDKDRVKNIIENINWPEESFLATNSSYNTRTSIISEALIKNGIIENK
jgi:hypothetical protein